MVQKNAHRGFSKAVTVSIAYRKACSTQICTKHSHLLNIVAVAGLLMSGGD